MATTNITLTITTPAGMTAAAAIDLFARANGYPVSGPMNPDLSNLPTKAEFAKKVLATKVALDIRYQQLVDARKTAEDTENAKQPVTVE